MPKIFRDLTSPNEPAWWKQVQAYAPPGMACEVLEVFDRPNEVMVRITYNGRRATKWLSRYAVMDSPGAMAQEVLEWMIDFATTYTVQPQPGYVPSVPETMPPLIPAKCDHVWDYLRDLCTKCGITVADLNNLFPVEPDPTPTTKPGDRRIVLDDE